MSKGLARRALTLFAGGILAGACGGSSEKHAAPCEDGEIRECRCDDGTYARQICAEDGSDWEECECEGSGNAGSTGSGGQTGGTTGDESGGSGGATIGGSAGSTTGPGGADTSGLGGAEATAGAGAAPVAGAAGVIGSAGAAVLAGGRGGMIASGGTGVAGSDTGGSAGSSVAGDTGSGGDATGGDEGAGGSGTGGDAGSGGSGTGGDEGAGGSGTGGDDGIGGMGTGGDDGIGGMGTGGEGTGGEGTGGEGTGGEGTGGEGTGGEGTGGEGTGGEGTGGQGTGGASITGPCDIYADAGTPCVAAYSMVRRIYGNYTGPLYQVRSGSNPQNTGSGGTTHDIPQTADGFGDAAAQDAACAGTTCTVSLLYDQSGMGNHIPVATQGQAAGGAYADEDDFESIADAGPLTVGGNQVYSLYMDVRQGYRSPVGSTANGLPIGTEHQGIYMLADGTHFGTACCWEFGNATSTPAQGWYFVDALFFGVAYWGRGEGSGPWFMADFDAGVWAGGSNPGDPGWGALGDSAPPNPNNPSLQVPFALGFLKVSSTYALRMADLETASNLTTAYEGAMPKAVDHQGAVVLGVGGDNSNNSWGTFFEGAIVAGYPTHVTEDAVMQNVQAVGYGQ